MIYMCGDTIASLISGDAMILRVLGMFGVGSTLYAFEIRKYFSWIEHRVKELGGLKRTMLKTFMALMYFNPLWIFRHLCFVYLFSGNWSLISIALLKSASIAFIFNIPISIMANYIIQNRIPLDYRFWASAVFSGLMAIYYSMSSIWF
jgi:hypothetical protein